MWAVFLFVAVRLYLGSEITFVDVKKVRFTRRVWSFRSVQLLKRTPVRARVSIRCLVPDDATMSQ